MILVKLKGGLGNQLFQYAFGRKLATLNSTELKLDIGTSPEAFQKNTDRAYKLDSFNIRANVASKDDLRKIKNPYGIFSRIMRGFRFWILREYNIDFDNKWLVKKDNIFVDGFWQSYKYFDDIRPILLEEINLRKPFNEKSVITIKKIKRSDSSVSLHVRRGDYISDKETHNAHGTICTTKYYEQAVTRIKTLVPETVFFVFSDDINWVKKNLSLPSTSVFVSGPGIQDYEEIILMSFCKHNIIANSSFSWWGAWLNQNPDKIVIAPKKWVNRIPDPHPNIIPEGWIRI